MTNKALGNRLEEAFTHILSNDGYWVYRFQQNAIGQPADIIAVRNRLAYIFDCKVCVNGRFDLSRIEPNQETAFLYWEQRGNGSAYFVLYFEGELTDLFLVPFRVISYFELRGKKSITLLDLEEYERVSGTNLTLNEWRHSNGD